MEADNLSTEARTPPLECVNAGDSSIPKPITTFSDLTGLTMLSVDGHVGGDIVRFVSTDGRTFHLFHSQDCCEGVTVEDICGDLNDLAGSPILQAEESTSSDNPEGVTPEYQDSFTWTFYRISTIKGSVVIRWYGESNGYYSEGVDFAEVDARQRR